MKSFFQNPWSPILSTSLLGLLFFGLLPSLSLQFLNSRSLLIAFLGAGFLLVPWTLSWLHEVGFLKIFAIWLALAGVSYLTMPIAWDGNPKLAFASHVMAEIVIALLLSMVLIGVLHKQKQNGISGVSVK